MMQPPALFPGAEAFRFKDEIGLPFAVQFDELSRTGLMLEWPSLIEAARKAGWNDAQTFDAIIEGLTDSQAWPQLRAGIIVRLKRYILLTLDTGKKNK